MMITKSGITLNSKAMTFYSDPSHGWLRIHKGTLDRLGISNKISEYSYMKGSYAYLEEDCDAPLVQKELINRGFAPESIKQFFDSIENKTTERSSPIRRYDSYVSDNLT